MNFLLGSSHSHTFTLRLQLIVKVTKLYITSTAAKLLNLLDLSH